MVLRSFEEVGFPADGYTEVEHEVVDRRRFLRIQTRKTPELGFVGCYLPVELNKETVGLCVLRNETISDFLREALRSRAEDIKRQMTGDQLVTSRDDEQ